MTQTPLNGALIGCGFFARNHMHAWADLAGANIVAVCDRDAAKAAAMARDFNIPRHYTDAATMLRAEKLDFVDVATTADSHRALVELVCQHGLPAICQKPFANTMADAKAMVAAAKAANVLLFVHENFRWQKPFIVMKQMLDAGDIGAPHFARFSFRHSFDIYSNQPYLAQGDRLALMDMGLHLYDLARHFLGDVAQLACTTQRLNPIVKGEDAFTALMTHENGATSICDASLFSHINPNPFPQTVAWLEGRSGTLALDTDFTLTHHHKGTRTTLNTEPDIPAWGEKPWHAVQDSVVNFQRHVIAALHGEISPQPSGADNLKTLALALASYESAALGRTIDMKLWHEGGAR